MKVDSTSSPTHTRTYQWQRGELMIPIYSSAVIIVYAQSSCQTLPLQCPSSLLHYLFISLALAPSHTKTHTKTHTAALTLKSQWLPFVRASCRRELCGLLLKRRNAEAEKFISNCGKKKGKSFQERQIFTWSVLKTTACKLSHITKHCCGGHSGLYFKAASRGWSCTASGSSGSTRDSQDGALRLL